MNASDGSAVSAPGLDFWRRVILVLSFLGLCSERTLAEEVRSCFSLNNYQPAEKAALWGTQVTLAELPTHHQLAARLRKGEKLIPSDSFFPLQGHQIIPGKDTVFLYREWFPGWKGVSDTSTFTQVTVISPQALAEDGKIVLGEPSGAMVFFSAGFPSFRDFCFGYAVKGELSYVTTKGTAGGGFLWSVFSALGIKEGIRVLISAEFTLVSTKAGENCGRCILNGDLIFQSADITTLQKPLQ